MNTHRTSWMMCALLLVSSCTPKSNEPTPAPEPAKPAADTHAEHAAEPAAAPPALPAIPPDAKVSFVEPADGATIQGALENGKVAVPVKMGATGIEVKPAGAVEAGSGHHHILVDVDAPSAGTVVPADAQHLHFGKGQTEATLSLTPGPHRLTLQFADGLHRAYGPPLSSTINVTVAATGTTAAVDAPGAVAPSAEKK